jgi:predicted acyltransferase
MILVNNPGSRQDTYAPLLHSDWNGATFADTIFPAFLWIIGVALTLSTSARVDRGEGRGSLLIRAVRRSLLLFCCGVFLEMIVFPVRTFPYVAIDYRVQLTGVLQMIAVCYIFSFLIFAWKGWRGAILGVVILNLIYLGMMLYFPVPGCGSGPWTPECNFAGYLNRLLLSGYMWGVVGKQDPCGLGNILPAISTVLLGVLAGHIVLQALRPGQRTLRLLGLGSGWVVTGLLLSNWIPINKILWTTSYAILMAGASALCFAVLYWLADVQGFARWFKPLEIFGMNAVAAYIVSRVGINVPKVHFFGKTFYADVCQQIAGPANASLIYACAHVVAVYLVVWLMFRRRWFFRF